MSLQYQAFNESWPKPDIAVRVRTLVVQVQGKQTRIGRIVPVTATDRHTLQLYPFRLFQYPPFILPSSTICLEIISYFLMLKNFRSRARRMNVLSISRHISIFFKILFLSLKFASFTIFSSKEYIYLFISAANVNFSDLGNCCKAIYPYWIISIHFSFILKTSNFPSIENKATIAGLMPRNQCTVISLSNKSWPKPEIAVRVRTLVEQEQGKQTRKGRTAPVTATERQALSIVSHP